MLSPDRPAPPVLVLGLGNLLLEDEGIGVHAVAALTRANRLPEAVEVVDGGTAGMDLLDTIAGRRHLVVVDAVSTGRPPGSLVRLAGAEVPAFFQTKLSPHQLGLADLLASLTLLDAAPQTVTVLGFEPVGLDLSTDLSAAGAGALDALVMMILDELGGLGFPVTASYGSERHV